MPADFFAEARALEELGLAVFPQRGRPTAARPRRPRRPCSTHRASTASNLPFPSPTRPPTGPWCARSADRGLAQGAGLRETLDFVAAVRPGLKRLRIAVLADWSHSLRTAAPAVYARVVADSGADALLAHGLPPRLRRAHHGALRAAGLPEVTTCYPASSLGHRHRGGGPRLRIPLPGRALRAQRRRNARRRPRRSGAVRRLPCATSPSPPIAVGFGVSTADDLRSVARSGAGRGDRRLRRSGSAGTEPRGAGSDPVEGYRSFLADLGRPLSTCPKEDTRAHP